MHFQLRKAVVVTTIQLKSTRVRMFQTDNFIFQSIYVFKGSCGESSVYFQRNTFLAIFKEWVSKKNSSAVPVVIIYGTPYWQFSRSGCQKNSSAVPVVIFSGTLLWQFSRSGCQNSSEVQWSISKGYFLAIFQGVYTSPAIEIAQLKGISEKRNKNRVRDVTRTQGLAGLVHEVTPIVLSSPGWNGKGTLLSFSLLTW